MYWTWLPRESPTLGRVESVNRGACLILECPSSDLVKITTYLVRPEDVAAAGAARAKYFGDARPGSATIIVKALVRPEWLIEIEAIAAAKV
jgi:enamine deaminase RidA (YjgF/YER057c/UK114 family)